MSEVQLKYANESQIDINKRPFGRELHFLHNIEGRVAEGATGEAENPLGNSQAKGPDGAGFSEKLWIYFVRNTEGASGGVDNHCESLRFMTEDASSRPYCWASSFWFILG